jgi:hypothetical protein
MPNDIPNQARIANALAVAPAATFSQAIQAGAASPFEHDAMRMDGTDNKETNGIRIRSPIETRIRANTALSDPPSTHAPALRILPNLKP